MNLKNHPYCLSQAIPPIKNWLHGNKLNYLVLAASIFPMASTPMHAATENMPNQTIQSNQNSKVTYQGTVIDETGNPLPGVNITYKKTQMGLESLQISMAISPLPFPKTYIRLFSHM